MNKGKALKGKSLDKSGRATDVLIEDASDVSEWLEDMSFEDPRGPIRSPVLKRSAQSRSDKSSCEQQHAAKKRMRAQAPAIVKQTVDAIAKEFSGELLENLTDLVMKGYDETCTEKRNQLTELWLQGLG